jgi:sigma-54-specific transcriptional regulator
MGQMQTELHTGIDLALALIGQKNLPDLLCTAISQMQKTFGLERCWALELDLSGRTLHCSALADQQSSQGASEFVCDDFSHPFAHLLQSGRPCAVSRNAGYRLEHPGFQALIELSGRPGSMWLEPFFGSDGRTLGVLVLCSDQPEWASVTEQALYRSLCQIISHQWVSVLRNHDQIWQRRLLKRSLDHLQDAQLLRQRAKRLATVLVGHSQQMDELRLQTVRAASSQLAVLVQAETGCGKDVVAQAVHEFSARAKGPMVVVNCAAIPDTLLESQLFGHTKGAFSGADRAQEGLLTQARGGTLFLDEIGDMPLALQAKLLRVLESGQFRPLGAQQEQHSDFRLVAATHQPLQQAINDGRFRRDLFYRLNQFPLRIEPLRQRPDDLEALTRHFIRAYCEREGAGPQGISSRGLQRLKRYDFPGNVRELRNVIELACLQTPLGDDIQPDAIRLDDPFNDGFDNNGDAPPANGQCAQRSNNLDCECLAGLPPLAQVQDLKAAAQAFEAALIRQRLQQYRGNRSQAAQSLGLPKRTLAHKCLKYDVMHP